MTSAYSLQLPGMKTVSPPEGGFDLLPKFPIQGLEGPEYC